MARRRRSLVGKRGPPGIPTAPIDVAQDRYAAPAGAESESAEPDDLDDDGDAPPPESFARPVAAQDAFDAPSPGGSSTTEPEPETDDAVEEDADPAADPDPVDAGAASHATDETDLGWSGTSSMQEDDTAPGMFGASDAEIDSWEASHPVARDAVTHAYDDDEPLESTELLGDDPSTELYDDGAARNLDDIPPRRSTVEQASTPPPPSDSRSFVSDSEPPPPERELPPSLRDGPDAGFTDALLLGDPPTEEVPSAVLEDLSQMYSAPMNVPEPPPIPGILDRYTPAMPPNRPPPGPEEEQRPSYLATPIPVRRDEAGITGRPPAPPPEPDPGVSRGVLIAGGLLVALLVVLGALLVGLLVGGGLFSPRPSGPAPRVMIPTPPPASMPGRDPTDEVLGTVEVDTEEAGPDSEATPDTEAPSTAPVGPVKPRVQRPPKRTVPAIESGTRPSTTPPPTPVASNGTIKVRSNKRVLVYVNEKPVGYTPLDLGRSPGDYSLSAFPAGKKEDTQTRTVDLGAGEIEVVEFDFE